ncbi:MAG TPA: M56 family metallopeptidase [Bacteroidales bacterium]|nr:M56 family metallopeptidase [Bacteroidales bacterium]
MEAIAMYLLKSVTWLTGFLIVYVLFLGNERYFTLNRIYLVTGILASVFLPFISIRYMVELPAIRNVVIPAGNIAAAKSGLSPWPDYVFLLIFILYISGIVFVVYRAYNQNRLILKTIRKTRNGKDDPVKLIRTADYTSSFSYFSYVFINPSVSDDEIGEIMNHELVHVRQMHWIDLLLARVLCSVQWFNPLVWIYVRYIRQNHEYLADEVALQLSSDPAVYRAALLNQTLGIRVAGLANSFNESLTKKRFNMMKKIISSPYRKLKFFLILPVAALIFYVFATPVYSFPVQPVTHDDKAPAWQENSGTNVPEAVNSEAAVFNNQDTVVKSKKVNSKEALLPSPLPPPPTPVKDVSEGQMPPPPPPVSEVQGNQLPPPPPPPPPPVEDTARVIIREVHNGGSVDTGVGQAIQVSGKNKALIIIDGKKTDIDVSLLDPQKIESVSVLKGEQAKDAYGREGRNGVIFITTKKPTGTVSVFPEKFPSGPDAPLLVIDGKVSDKGIDSLSPDDIFSLNVLKGKSAMDKYGDAGKNGVVEITTKGAK